MSIKIKNIAKHDFKFVPYRIDGLILDKDLEKDSNVPKIGPGECLRIRGGEVRDGSADSLILMAFLKDSKVPPAIGITVETTGGGGGFSIVIAGFGGGVNASATVPIEFSQPLAAQRMFDGSRFQYVENKDGEFSFVALAAGADLDCTKSREL